ncbi:MAG: hypothetical protein INF65_10105 [Roseomonas sp.]|nr:hypothetical protein [Roseomonas sp.]MCA3405811.1 hypothetical protein [Roseomonas sp.]
MHTDMISTLFGHSPLGAVLAVFAMATALWLLFAFQSARSAILEVSNINQSLPSGAFPRLQGRAP